MRIGIDFGTTRTVVACEDRGNYPLVCFRDPRGSWIEWYPSRIAARHGALSFGHHAEALRGDPHAWHLSSIKRLLSWSAPDHAIDIPGVGRIALLELLTMYIESLARELRSDAANIHIADDEPLEAMVSVPANANSNQRFLTLEAFKAGGFSVVGMMNEPSAAGVEYAHRFVKRPEGPRQKQYLAVYDLGGGTFDAAAIQIAGMRHEVISSEGVERLGGDDFDEVLLDMVADPYGGSAALDGPTRAHLLDECRDRKESLNAHTRKILVDTSILGTDDAEVVILAADYYERCSPLVDRTIVCLERVLSRLTEHDDESDALPSSVATVYLVGGSTHFPLVLRSLRDRYGRRIQRSQYPHGAVAIGLAVAANPKEPYFVRETLTRHFGVFREAEHGRRVVFDPIFVKDTSLVERDGHALLAERRYRPAHNIGHYRYAECASLSPDGHPDSGVAPWDAICFPFERSLQHHPDLASMPVERADPSETETIVEEYTCDTNGIVTVTLRSVESGFEQTFRLAGSLN
ncbi:MAG TPA: Hsp70 family protein [Blastocatellia bacterium]|nr:Hsp70 family protein [Blastocatellia bacterium]